MFLLQSGIIPLSFLPTSGLFCKDATHMHVKNKIYIGNGIMFKPRDYLDLKMSVQLVPYLYKLCSHLIYCIEVWVNASHCHIPPLF